MAKVTHRSHVAGEAAKNYAEFIISKNATILSSGKNNGNPPVSIFINWVYSIFHYGIPEKQTKSRTVWIAL